MKAQLTGLAGHTNSRVPLTPTEPAWRQADAAGDFAAPRAPVADDDLARRRSTAALGAADCPQSAIPNCADGSSIRSYVQAARLPARSGASTSRRPTVPRQGLYLDCHHIVPLHVVGIRVTRLADLALLCANCHRKIHVRAPRLSPEQLRQMIAASRAQAEK